MNKHIIITYVPGSVVLICPKHGHTSGIHTSIGVICSCGEHIKN